MQIRQQCADPSLGVLTADESDLTGVDVVDTATELITPSRVDLSLIDPDATVLIEAQQTAVDDGRTVLRRKREKRPLDL